MYLSLDEYEEVDKAQLVNLLIGHIENGTSVIEEAYMTKIQLRRIVDRLLKRQVNSNPTGTREWSKMVKTSANSRRKLLH